MERIPPKTIMAASSIVGGLWRQKRILRWRHGAWRWIKLGGGCGKKRTCLQMSSRCDYRSGMNDVGKYLPFREPWREPRRKTTTFLSQNLSRRKPLKETEFEEEIQAMTVHIPMSASPTVPVLKWSCIAVNVVTGAQLGVHSRNVELTGRHVEFTSALRSSHTRIPSPEHRKSRCGLQPGVATRLLAQVTTSADLYSKREPLVLSCL